MQRVVRGGWGRQGQGCTLCTAVRRQMTITEVGMLGVRARDSAASRQKPNQRAMGHADGAAKLAVYRGLMKEFVSPSCRFRLLYTYSCRIVFVEYCMFVNR
jgi:hypothetical protein